MLHYLLAISVVKEHWNILSEDDKKYINFQFLERVMIFLFMNFI